MANTEAKDSVVLSKQDMMGMGYTETEMEAELAKQNPPKGKEGQEGNEEQVITDEDKAAAEAKAAADKEAAEEVNKAEGKDKAVSDMLFKADREAKLKARQEEIEKARQERIATADPKELAKENEELNAARREAAEERAVRFTNETNYAIEKVMNSVGKEEWEILAPTIEEWVKSSKYDEVVFDKDGYVKKGLNAEEIIGGVIATAKGANFEKLSALKLKKAKEQESAETRIDELKDFGVRRSPGDKGAAKTELDILHEKADSGAYMNRGELSRMVQLENKEEAAKRPPKK